MGKSIIALAKSVEMIFIVTPPEVADFSRESLERFSFENDTWFHRKDVQPEDSPILNATYSSMEQSEGEHQGARILSMKSMMNDDSTSGGAARAAGVWNKAGKGFKLNRESQIQSLRESTQGLNEQRNLTQSGARETHRYETTPHCGHGRHQLFIVEHRCRNNSISPWQCSTTVTLRAVTKRHRSMRLLTVGYIERKSV